MAAHQPPRPGLSVGLICGLLLSIQRVGHRAGDGGIGDAEHRLLEADAALNVHIGLPLIVVFVLSALSVVTEYVLRPGMRLSKEIANC